MNLIDLVNGRADGPRFERVRRERKVRTVTVHRTQYVTPDMLRVTCTGSNLSDFDSLGFDDHLKVVLSNGGRRDYTPRRFDAASRMLGINFALHPGGAASDWAVATAPACRCLRRSRPEADHRRRSHLGSAPSKPRRRRRSSR